MPSFAIQPATVADIPVIIKIQEQTWEPTYREILEKEQIDYMFQKIYSHESLQNQIEAAGHKFFILFNQDIPEGFASVSEDEPESFKLHKIYVLPSTQGSGAGKYLLHAVESWVRFAGGKKIALNVNRYNKARTFYERMGYRVTGEKDIPIGPYWMNDFILEKELG
ncbi:GNAT family N-acetyltransferase [Dyadobacter bucti]|uniref:GNAT family N-acetyltransferase n=1 Tax=Dyadobacter bucti TaxID=2572203 RepID=UPI001108ADF9|nr:GNAT family N-acetyltransferase [Dyadobacter bucti]